jgi:hypothetical protein
MHAVPQHNNNTAALNATKERFVRLPSNTTSPRFRDLVTGIEQSDARILSHYYSRQGGRDLVAAQLLEVLDVVYNETFKPGACAIIRDGTGSSLNLWKQAGLRPSANAVETTDIGPFIEFMKRLLPEDLERHYFCWWLAHTVRHPEQRIIATPVLRSEHGVGKGFLVETLMAGLIGLDSVAVCRMNDLTGSFNDIIEGKTTTTTPFS